MDLERDTERIMEFWKQVFFEQMRDNTQCATPEECANAADTAAGRYEQMLKKVREPDIQPGQKEE